MVEFGQNWVYSGKLIVFGLSVCIWVKSLYSGKVVVFGQNDCIWEKMVVFG